jgi:hypothetical protein
MNRRGFLETTAALPWLEAASRTEGRTAPAGALAFRLAETEGIRRYGYPVSVRLPFSDPGENLRLTRGGREIQAQFRRVEGPGAQGALLDFNASPGPFEVEDYVIAPVEGKYARPASGRGMRAASSLGTIEVANPPHITYSLGEDLTGFLRSVRIPGVEFLRPRSGGLFVGTRAGKTYLGSARTADGRIPRAVVTRQGPLAVGVGFEHAVPLEGGPVLTWNLTMTFPSSKSWVEVLWSIADPDDRIASMGVDLELLLEGKPVLIDCGARSTVYSTLEPQDRLAFDAGPALTAQGRELSWRIARGQADPLALEAAGVRKDGSGPEGWVHVMDRTRCTAMAVADFGDPSAGRLDRFEIEGRGLLRFERQFRPVESGPSPGKAPAKSLRFWLHFVTMPVQVGAKTSPQAMLAPLDVQWQRP